MASIYNALLRQLNRTGTLNAQPFDPDTDVGPPRGRWGVVHYGVMIPNLPEPLRFFDAVVILGTARAPIFDNRALVQTSHDDSAWILIGSAITAESFRPYSIAGECDIAPDGSLLRFGDALTIDRTGDGIVVEAVTPRARAELALRPTTVVSHFSHLPGLYDHWSVLCEYHGSFSTDSAEFTRKGLCTYEYARAVNLPLPFLFFAYQIIDVDNHTQVLMVEVLGPAGLPIQRTVYVRTIDHASTHTRGYRHTVVERGQTLTTPDGHPMRMPKRFTWRVEDDDGDELISINGSTNDDWAYGLAAGYVGSYHYAGTFCGSTISGTGYIEWIDRR